MAFSKSTASRTRHRRTRVFHRAARTIHRSGHSRRRKIQPIFAIGHFGNFELYTILAARLPGYRATAATFRSLKQPGLTRLMEELRNRSGCIFFERRVGLRDLMRALGNNDLFLGLLSDQHGGPKGVWGPFFGIECSTLLLPLSWLCASIARSTPSSVIALDWDGGALKWEMKSRCGKTASLARSKPSLER